MADFSSLALASSFPPDRREAYEGMSVEVSTSRNDVRVLNRRRDTSRSQEYHDWILEKARAVPAKKGAELTGLTPRGFQDIRAGKSKPSSEALTKWCRNDAGMAVAYAIHIGVILPGDAEAVEAMMRGVHAFMRRQP